MASDWLVNAIFRPAFLYTMICCCFLLFYVTFSDISAIYSDGTQTPSFRILTCIQILMPWAAIAVIYGSSPPCTGTLTRKNVFNLLIPLETGDDVAKLLACGARSSGFNPKPCRHDLKELGFSCFQVEM